MKRHKPEYLSNNKVRLLRGGLEYFELLEQMIDEAVVSIHLQTYIFDPDETGSAIANALIRAAERNVKVYVLVDAYGSQKLSAPFIQRLTGAGILFRKFRPVFKSRRFYIGRRLHHKVVVIDTWRSMVGGINISNRYNDTHEGPAWLDWALYAEGEAAYALENVCKRRLRLRYKTEKPDRAPKITTPCRVGIRINDWVSRERQIYNTYLRMFREASSYLIVMSAYFLPGRQFRKKIALASTRGVKIKVVLTRYADVYLIKYAERYIYRWLFRNNIEVYEYQKSMLHAKIAACDGQCITVGSYNVNNLSAYGSIELNMEVNDAAFAQNVQQQLEQVISNECVQITEESFNKSASLMARILHRFAYEVFRLLFFLSTRQTG